MRVVWTDAARRDLHRLDEFLKRKNPRAAAGAMLVLTEAPEQLILQPRIGQRVETITAREVRRIFVGDYELRYVVVGQRIEIARVFHTRENR
jgi:plasmid stabilization system protein ParE